MKAYKFMASIGRSDGYDIVRRSDRMVLGYVRQVGRGYWHLTSKVIGKGRAVTVAVRSREQAAEMLMERCR